MTYFINPSPKETAEKTVFNADNGKGFVKDHELHLQSTRFYYVYKFNDSPVGWYMKNQQTSEDIFLGIGACPTLVYTNIKVLDESYWADIATKSPADEILELEQWFAWYDMQVAQYSRAVRLGEAFDKDINELDGQAVENAEKLKLLRQLN